MIWAFHSESQELLLSTSISACGGKMCWPDARALGVFIWMRAGDAMVSRRTIPSLKFDLTLVHYVARSYGGRSAERVHVWGQPRSHGM